MTSSVRRSVFHVPDGQGADRRFIVQHQWMAHPGSRCETCGKYVYREDMAQHLLDSPNHPICTICRTGFHDSGTLYDVCPCTPTHLVSLTTRFSQHMAIAHPELCCSLCHMIFSSKEHLREHHKTTRRHPSCTHCNVGFSSEALLRRVRFGVLRHVCSLTSFR